MRHGVKLNHLGRTASHRKALLSRLACELILHKRITTTLAKAKALRVYVEPLLTKSKTNTTHQRRVVFSYLNDKQTITELFGAISEKIADRPGGYTRIIKLGTRLGDAAEMALIELVDYNEVYSKEAPGAGKKKKTRRRSGGSKKKTEDNAESVEHLPPAQDEEVETTPAADDSPVTEVQEEPSAKDTATTDEKVENEKKNEEDKKPEA